MSAPARLLLFGDEQFALPGLRGAVPALRLAPLPGGGQLDAGVARPCPGQLRLDHAQLLLADTEPEPTQPSLLPEPPFWEGGGLVPARWVDFSTSSVEYPPHLRRKASPGGTQLDLFQAR